MRSCPTIWHPCLYVHSNGLNMFCWNKKKLDILHKQNFKNFKIKINIIKSLEIKSFKPRLTQKRKKEKKRVVCLWVKHPLRIAHQQRGSKELILKSDTFFLFFFSFYSIQMVKLQPTILLFYPQSKC